MAEPVFGEVNSDRRSLGANATLGMNALHHTVLVATESDLNEMGISLEPPPNACVLALMARRASARTPAEQTLAIRDTIVGAWNELALKWTRRTSHWNTLRPCLEHFQR